MLQWKIKNKNFKGNSNQYLKKLANGLSNEFGEKVKPSQLKSVMTKDEFLNKLKGSKIGTLFNYFSITSRLNILLFGASFPSLIIFSKANFNGFWCFPDSYISVLANL